MRTAARAVAAAPGRRKEGMHEAGADAATQAEEAEIRLRHALRAAPMIVLRTRRFPAE